MSADRPEKKVALVLSGGGANGAYEVGVLKALLTGQSRATLCQPLIPDIVVGTSAGAINAAFLVSQWDRYGAAVVGNLEQFWLDRIAGGFRGNGVYHIRANPFQLLDPRTWRRGPLGPFSQAFEDGVVLGWDFTQRLTDFALDPQESLEEGVAQLVNLSSFVSTAPLEQTLRAVDFAAIRDSRVWLKVIATNWATGELREWWNHDMADDFGPIALQASASIPGFFLPTIYGAQPHVDGSVLLNTPLRPAIRAGATEIHVVYLDPEIRNIPLPRHDNTLDTLVRMQQIAWGTSVRDDIDDAARINRGLESLRKMLAGEGLEGGDPRAVVEAAGQLEKFVSTARGQRQYQPLTIYRYFPNTPLEGGMPFLNFDRDRLALLIQRGFDDAVAHDFTASEDVFPDQETKRRVLRAAGGEAPGPLAGRCEHGHLHAQGHSNPPKG